MVINPIAIKIHVWNRALSHQLQIYNKSRGRPTPRSYNMQHVGQTAHFSQDTWLLCPKTCAINQHIVLLYA